MEGDLLLIGLFIGFLAGLATSFICWVIEDTIQSIKRLETANKERREAMRQIRIADRKIIESRWSIN
jgi:hypothetical protein